MAFQGMLQREPSLGEKFSRSIGAGLQQGSQLMQNREENEALQKLTGQNFAGMSPEMKKEFVKLFTGARSQKEQEKHQMLETGLGTIQQMRQLLEHAGPSNWVRGLMGGETTRNRAQLEQLGRSLIPVVAAGVPIRNQREFDEYSKIITNPNSRQSALEGALDGIQNILERSSGMKGDMQEESMESQGNLPVFDPSNPSHKKVRDALLKKLGNNREKVARELSRHFREE